MRKRYEELEFTDDYLFGKILTSRPDLCKKLLEMLLGIEIKEIRPPEGQKTIETAYDSRGIRLDVYVNDDKGTVFDLEMQTVLKPDIPKRARYYQGTIDQSMIQKGEPYSSLRKSYVIFICTGDLFGKRLPVYTFENVCLEDTSLHLEDEAVKVIVNPDCERAGLSDEMKSFMELLKGRAATSGVAKDIADMITDVRRDRRWEGDYMTFDMKLREEREEGRAEGRAEGLAEGLAKGLAGLVRDGLLELSEAAKRAEMSEDEFKAYMAEHEKTNA